VIEVRGKAGPIAVDDGGTGAPACRNRSAADGALTVKKSSRRPAARR